MIDSLIFHMRMSTILLSVLLLIIHIYLYRKGKLKFSKRNIKLLIIFFILILIAASTSIIRPITFIYRSVCLASLFLAIHTCYVIVNQFIYGEKISYFRNKMFYIFTFFTSTEIFLLYFERYNLNSFLDTQEYFTLSLRYYLIQVIMFFYPIIVHIVTIDIIYEGLKGRNIKIFVRRACSLGTLYVSLIWWILGIIKITLLVFGVKGLYLDHSMIIIRSLVLPIYILPFIPIINNWLCKKINPLYLKLEKERLYWLNYLHSMKEPVITSIDRAPEILLNEHRIITELGDMREILWSTIPHRFPLNARTEARYIYELRHNGQTISDYGQYPAHTARFNSTRYNVKVSKYLYQLEAHNAI